MTNEEQSETFRDVARICVKKSNKGPFDELITSLYRVKQLTEFIPQIESSWDDKTILMKCISQGLKYTNFKTFKDEVIAFSSFSDLKDCDSIKEFYALLEQDENKLSIEKKLLCRFQGVLHDHEFALQFLKNWVSQEVETLQQEAAQIQSGSV